MTGAADQPLSVVLVGPPGAGKSTIGRKLARELGVDLYDTDAGIEEQTGRTIPEIFAEDGEPEFRRIEEQVVRDAVLAGHGIISLGGGSVLSAATRELLRGRTVVYLEISVGEGLRRTGASTNRPLLNGADPAAKYRELMKIRRPLYREVASVRVRTDGRSPGRVVRMILAKLGLESTLPEELTAVEPPVVTVEPGDSARSRSRRRRRRGRGDTTAAPQPNATVPETNSTSVAQAADSTSETSDSTDDSTKSARRGRRSRRRSSRAAGPATTAADSGKATGATPRTGEPAGIVTETGSATTTATAAGTAARTGGSPPTAAARTETPPETGASTAATNTAAPGAANTDGGAVAANMTQSGGAVPSRSRRGRRRGASRSRGSAQTRSPRDEMPAESQRATTAEATGGGRSSAEGAITRGEHAAAEGAGSAAGHANTTDSAGAASDAANSEAGRKTGARPSTHSATGAATSGPGAADAATGEASSAAGGMNSTGERQDSVPGEPGAGRSRRARARRARARARGENGTEQIVREESEQPL